MERFVTYHKRNKFNRGSCKEIYIHPFQHINNFVQESQDLPLKIICYDEERLMIAREKLRQSSYTTLHVDTTSGVVRQLNGEVYLTSASFSGILFSQYT